MCAVAPRGLLHTRARFLNKVTLDLCGPQPRPWGLREGSCASLPGSWIGT